MKPPLVQEPELSLTGFGAVRAEPLAKNTAIPDTNNPTKI
jgi:hypothetical protein